MMAQLQSVWAARTPRERMLLRALGALIAGVFLPLWLLSAAYSFRAEAAQELARAETLRADVARVAALRAEAAPLAALDGDRSLRARALAAAQAAGLTVQRVEDGGAGRAVFVLAPADSLRVYRWIGDLGRGGVYVQRTVIARSGDGGTVSAELTVSEAPS